IGAVWGLLTGTRLLRGEEEAGRFELLLCGPTTRAGAARQGVIGLGAGLVALFAVTAAITVADAASPEVGFPTPAALFLVVALVAGPAVFLTVGTAAGELASTRRQANIIGGAVVGGSYLLRMVADSGSGLGWLRWATPLGWVEELRPLTGSRLLAL